MRSKRHYIIFVLLILAFQVRAQVDTTVTVSPYEELLEEKITVNRDIAFDTITEADKIPVQQRKVSGSKVQSIRNEKDFWYVNEKPVREQPQEPKKSGLDNLMSKKWFRNLLWFLVVGSFISVLIWFILSSDIRLFSRKSVSLKKVEEGTDERSIFDISFEEEIRQAVSAGNFRGAVRLLYLQTLKELSDRRLIRYKQDRTNNDYLLQLFGTASYEHFFRLTRHFEYAWYGQFPVNNQSFEAIRSDFSTFKNQFLR